MQEFWVLDGEGFGRGVQRRFCGLELGKLLTDTEHCFFKSFDAMRE